jgi:hypothetical protein
MRVRLALVLLVALVPSAPAWGPVGHSIIAKIAERRLTQAVAAQVRQILAS